MGNWLLEVGKMAIYMTFPVALFHYFNQPEYFEKFVIEKKREMYPHEDDTFHEEIEQIFRLRYQKREKEAFEAFEAFQRAEFDRKARKAEKL